MKTKFSNRFCFIIALVGLLFVSPIVLKAQVKVYKVTGPEMLTGRRGIIYNLPRTLVNVDIWIEKTQQLAGPLADYADEYLGLDNVITKNSVSYAIIDADIRTEAEPDPGQFYIIEKEEKASGEIWVSFGNKSPVLTIEKFEKTITPPGFMQWHEDLFENTDPEPLFRKYTESSTREVIDTIIRKLSIDTLVLEEMIFRHSMVEFSDEEKAQEAASRIKQIEHDQYNLLIGYQETAYPKGTIEFMIKKLEEQRLEFLKLFTGIGVTEVLQFEFMAIPDPENEEGEYKLAGFSTSNGMTGKEGQQSITIRIKPEVSPLTPVATGSELASTGIAYRLPQTVQAVLSLQDRELASKRIEVLQLSPILTLPTEFKRVEFDTQTGALKSVVIE